MDNLTLVIPAKNEKESLPSVLEELKLVLVKLMKLLVFLTQTATSIMKLIIYLKR